MERWIRLPSPLTAIRLAVAIVVVAWLVGPEWLRSTVPIFLVFLLALAVELHFFVGAVRATPRHAPDRLPQEVDRERFGYEAYEDDDEPPLEDWDEEDDDEPEPAESSASPVRRFLVGLGIVGALVLLLWLVESRTGWDSLERETRARAEARFSAEASRIARKPVTIRCDESGRHVGAVQHADGAAVVGGDLAYLTPERCLQLYRLAFDGETASSQTARAIAVLSHEAWHLRGVADEAATECFAFQSGVGLARRLGVPEATAARLMRQQLAENTLRRGGSFEYRVSPDCRDGGRLDLNPGLARFP